MMKTKLISVLLILAVLLTLLPLSAAAAPANENAVKITLVKDNQTFGRDVLRLDLMVKTGLDTAGSQQLYFRYDATKFVPLNQATGADATEAVSAATFATNLADTLTRNNYVKTTTGMPDAASTVQLNTVISGGTGYVSWKVTEPAGTGAFSTFTRVSSIFLALKEGVSFAALPAESIRLSIPATDKAVTGAAWVAEIWNGTSSYHYGQEGGGDDLITAPLVEAGSGVTLVKATPVYNPPANAAAVYGSTLASIALTNPEGNTPGAWTWVNPGQSVGAVGTRSFKANFTPTDTGAYNAASNVDVSVTVGPKALGDVAVSGIGDQAYTGNPTQPTVTVTGDGGKTLSLNADYTLTYMDNTDAGTGSVIVSPASGGNYTFPDITQYFNIIPAQGVITISGSLDKVYDGDPADEDAIAVNQNGNGSVDICYYTNQACTEGERSDPPADAGTYWAKAYLSGGTNHGSAESNALKFTISPAPIPDGVKAAVKGYSGEYDGNSHDAVSAGGAAAGYTLRYATSKNGSATDTVPTVRNVSDSGTYWVEISLNNNYKTERISLNAAVNRRTLTVTGGAVAGKTYDGTSVFPVANVSGVTFDRALEALQSGTDYKVVSASANSPYAGSRQVTVVIALNSNSSTAKNYVLASDSFTVQSAISAAVQVLSAKQATLYVSAGGTLSKSTLEANIAGAYGKLSFSGSGTAGGIDSKGNFAAAQAAGTVKITATAASGDLNSDGKPEYSGGETTFKVTVQSKPDTSGSIRFSDGSATYSGAEQTYEKASYSGSYANFTYSYKAVSGTLGKKGKPLTAGTYKVTATYDDGTRTGTATAYFTIEPKELTVKAGSYEVSKVYDGTLTAGTGSGSLKVTGILSGDTDVKVTAKPQSFTYADAYRQDTVKADLTIAGDKYGNYTLSDSRISVPCEITPKPLTISSVTVANKTYDGTTTATVTKVTFKEKAPVPAIGSGVIASASFASAAVGSSVTVKGAITLTDSNYSLNGSSFTTKASITKGSSAITLSVGDFTITYGQVLTTASLNSAKAAVNGSTIAGTFTWDVNPLALVKKAGAYTGTVRFTPTDSKKYAAVTKQVTITVTKAQPKGTPVFDPITASGYTLKDAALSLPDNGFTNPNNSAITVPGELNWNVKASTEVEKGKAYTWVFTPDDTGNYATVSGTFTPYTSDAYYELSFETNGGSQLSDVRVRADKVLYLSDYTTTRFGYTFMGWYLDKGLSRAVTKLTMDGDYTVYAKWVFAGNTDSGGDIIVVKPLPFTDTPDEAWYYGYVGELYSGGVVNGYPDNTFRPQGAVTWGEALKLILKAVGYSDQSQGADEHWASGYMYRAIVDGLISGSVDLSAVIDRGDIADLAAKALKLGASTIANPFEDEAPSSAAALYQAGIITGSLDGGHLFYRADSSITRAEMAAIVWRIYNVNK